MQSVESKENDYQSCNPTRDGIYHLYFTSDESEAQSPLIPWLFQLGLKFIPFILKSCVLSTPFWRGEIGLKRILQQFQLVHILL